MPRGTKPGSMRGPYRPHSRAGKVTDDQVRMIRSADSVEIAYVALLRENVRLAFHSIAAIRARKRKALVPDAAPELPGTD